MFNRRTNKFIDKRYIVIGGLGYWAGSQDGTWLGSDKTVIGNALEVTELPGTVAILGRVDGNDKAGFSSIDSAKILTGGITNETILLAAILAGVIRARVDAVAFVTGIADISCKAYDLVVAEF